MAKIISGPSSSDKILEQSIPLSSHKAEKIWSIFYSESTEIIALSPTERITQSTAKKLKRINHNNKFPQIAFCLHLPLQVRECTLETQPAQPSKKLHCWNDADRHSGIRLE